MIETSFSYRDALLNITEKDLSDNQNLLSAAYDKLINRTGKGNDFLGWLDLPETITSGLIGEIQDKAAQLASISEVSVVIGIGGSYLGTRAVVEMLSGHFNCFCQKDRKYPQLLYAGNHLSEDYMADLIDILDQKDYSLIVISKSGTTTEPAIAFRILKEHCEKKYGKEQASQRIVAVTDEKKGALRKLATENHYTTFNIPDDVGGRYSVLTPVGLFPIALAGFDIKKILEGADRMRQYVMENKNFDHNIALQYALLRFLLYKNRKKIELMVAYEPRLYYFIEWFKQLFGESEGKEHKGLFPAGVIFSTDLHSLGQYIQEGERNLFETVISIGKSGRHVSIPFDEQDTDSLNYLQEKSIHTINLTAEEGTRMAHVDGGVPNLRITVPGINESVVGELIYFFEFSCAVSGYLLDINPFDQPGVEAYKKNMFRLLGKPR